MLRAAVTEACENLAKRLRAQSSHGEPLRVHVDLRDISGGNKTWEWIKKGVPMRIEIGPRDLEKNSAAVCRRDRGVKEKEFLPLGTVVAFVTVIGTVAPAGV